MFKLIFEILTDPLGLPIEWYWEYLILTVIGAVAYAVAYRCVGDMYSGGMIDGSTSGSFFHWLIRLILFVVLWAVTYGIIAVNYSPLSCLRSTETVRHSTTSTKTPSVPISGYVTRISITSISLVR